MSHNFICAFFIVFCLFDFLLFLWISFFAVQQKNLDIIAKSIFQAFSVAIFYLAYCLGRERCSPAVFFKPTAAAARRLMGIEREGQQMSQTPRCNTLLAVFWGFSLRWKEECVGLSCGALAIDIAHFKAKGMAFCELPPLQGWFVPLHSFAAHFSLSRLPPCASRPHVPPCCFLAFYFPRNLSSCLLRRHSLGLAAAGTQKSFRKHTLMVGGGRSCQTGGCQREY